MLYEISEFMRPLIIDCFDDFAYYINTIEASVFRTSRRAVAISIYYVRRDYFYFDWLLL